MSEILIHKIYAIYDDENIRVYQAYNNKIADEAVELQTFGKSFKMERMTWIKPSFLWMMYRSGWARKEGQERILAIDIKRSAFDEILSNGVLSTCSRGVYDSKEEWKAKLAKSEVRCQWDPERDIYGNPIDRRSIQIGLKGSMVELYVNSISKITDITDKVIEYREMIDNDSFDLELLPEEKEYIPNI